MKAVEALDCRDSSSRSTQGIGHAWPFCGSAQSSNQARPSMDFLVGSAQQAFHVENVDACASGFTLTTDGETLLAVEARSLAAVEEDMFLIVNALR